MYKYHEVSCYGTIKVVHTLLEHLLSNKQHWPERHGTPRLCVEQPFSSNIKQTMQVLTDPLRLYLNIYTFSVNYSNVRRHTECTTDMLALQSSCLCGIRTSAASSCKCSRQLAQGN